MTFPFQESTASLTWMTYTWQLLFRYMYKYYQQHINCTKPKATDCRRFFQHYLSNWVWKSHILPVSFARRTFSTMLGMSFKSRSLLSLVVSPYGSREQNQRLFSKSAQLSCSQSNYYYYRKLLFLEYHCKQILTYNIALCYTKALHKLQTPCAT